MPNFIDLTGHVYGRLAVNGPHKGGRTKIRWLCTCECGKLKWVTGANMRNGHTKSCGCLSIETNTKRLTTHGKCHTPEYHAWHALKKRCGDKTLWNYKNYGGRGIKVLIVDFENFLKEVGPRPTPQHSIDRINNNGHYEIGNIRWATPSEQARNTRKARMIEYKGRTKCIHDWADITGASYTCIYQRIRNGWSVEDALTRPVRIR